MTMLLSAVTTAHESTFTPQEFSEIAEAGRVLEDHIANTPASVPLVYADALTRTVRAVDSAADLFYGLKAGTNGSGPTMRREGIGGRGYSWVCSDGTPATGLHLIPASTSDDINTNPWGGSPLSADGGRIFR